MAQMLAMVVYEKLDDWGVHLPHVEFAYIDSVSVATGLAPNEVHMNRLLRLPMTLSWNINMLVGIKVLTAIS